MSARVLYLKGMHGMGDNFHERAFIRQYLSSGRYDCIYLETSWPVLFWDLVGDKLKLIQKDSGLRTQAKNANREQDFFYKGRVPLPNMRTDKQIWYRAKDIKQTGSVLGAMAECLGEPVGEADFRFPLKDEWQRRYFNEILPKIDAGGKPILVYRPLVERTEWSGCSARNPDHDTYRTLYRSIRDRFHVVSVADIVPGKEWIVGASAESGCGISDTDTDTEFHKGELPVEMLATLVKNAAMTMNAPGFMTIMSQSQGTPNVTVFGGYENSKSFTAGAKWAPYLGIDPINSCQCFQHSHPCDKRINIPEALDSLKRFTDAALTKSSQLTSGAASNPEVAA